MKKSAIVFGATGLIGSFVLKQLLADERYSSVKIFVRHSTRIQHSKLQEAIIDFEKLSDCKEQMKCDDFFCCLGTTIKVAGSQEAFRKVDFEWVKWCAESAAANGVKNFMVISSMGANATSKNFYLRTKGEMENVVNALPFEKKVILRPSILLGARKEFRFGELIGKFVMQAFAFMVPARYKGVQAETVARAMIGAANGVGEGGVMENAEIREF